MASTNWKDLQKTAKEATEAIPPGDYLVQVESAEYAEASTGKDMIKLKVRILEGAYKGRPIFTNLVLAPESGFALNLFFARIMGLGVTQSHLDDEISVQAMPEIMKDRIAMAKVEKDKPYQGQERTQITTFTDPGADVMQPSSAGGIGGLGSNDAFASGGLGSEF
jgi:hypothetical protein